MKYVTVCDFCGFTDTIDRTEPHELACFYNPINKTCGTCKHQVEDRDCKFKHSRDVFEPLSCSYIKIHCNDWETSGWKPN